MTLSQLAAQSAAGEGADAWACPRCGCRDWRVVNSHLRGGERRRQRACRHCGEPLRTLEVPAPDGFKIALVPEDDQGPAPGAQKPAIAARRKGQ